MNDEDTLASIDAKLGALLAITLDAYVRNAGDGKSKAKPRSIDKVLNDAGLSQTQIAKLLGKSPQAVSQALKAKKRPKAKPSRRRR